MNHVRKQICRNTDREKLRGSFCRRITGKKQVYIFCFCCQKEGYEQIADLFLKTANNEKEHAKMWFKELQGIGDTAQKR